MFEAAGWGALSSSTLIVGALVAHLLKPSVRLTAAVMAIGSGLLIGSVAYDLVADAQHSRLFALKRGVRMLAVHAALRVALWSIMRRS